MQARIPQSGSNERLGTLRVDTFGGDNNDAARHLAFHCERCAEIRIGVDRRAAIDAKSSTHPRDKEQERDARIVDVAWRSDRLVAALDCQTGSIRFFDAVTGRTGGQWRVAEGAIGPGGPVELGALAGLASGEVAAGEDGLYLWHADGPSEPEPPRRLHEGSVWCLAGTPDGPDGQLVPNITPDPNTGIGKWEKDDVVELLRTGMTPKQSKVKCAMREVVEDGLKYLSDSDLEAIADYLFAQPPMVHDVTGKR